MSESSMEQHLRRAQAEGNETAALALADDPDRMAIIDSAWDAGARWSWEEDHFSLRFHGALETIAVVDPSDLTVDFNSDAREIIRWRADRQNRCATCGDDDHSTAEHATPLDAIPDEPEYPYGRES